jgi:hypothetical protein
VVVAVAVEKIDVFRHTGRDARSDISATTSSRIRDRLVRD